MESTTSSGPLGLQAPVVEQNSTKSVPTELVRWSRVVKRTDEDHKDTPRGEQVILNMENSNVSPRTVVRLAEYASQLNISLVWICLSGNSIGPNGAQALGRALVTNASVQFLELDACDLVGSPYRPQLEGVMALSKGIQSARSDLRFLNVANNNLQPEGCRILLGGVMLHQTLTALDISNNMLSLFQDKQGYMALGHVVEFSTRLCWLNMSRNPMPTTSVEALRASFASNHSLTAIYAKHCEIPREVRDNLLLTLSSTSNHDNSTGKAGSKSNVVRGSVLLVFEC